MKSDENNIPLENFINKIKSRMALQKIISTPRTFEDLHMQFYKETAIAFYTYKLCDMWLDEIPKRISRWADTIDEYFNKFDGDWKKYASFKRLEYIKEFGPDEEDLDDSGLVRKYNLNNNDLKHFTIFNDLYSYESRDILQDFIPEDISYFQQAIAFESTIDIKSIFRNTTGKELSLYTMSNETGRLRPMQLGEYELQREAKIVDAECDFNSLIILSQIISDIMNKLRKFDNDSMFDNNHKFLKQMRKNCDFIKYLRFEKVIGLDIYKEMKDNKDK